MFETGVISGVDEIGRCRANLEGVMEGGNKKGPDAVKRWASLGDGGCG